MVGARVLDSLLLRAPRPVAFALAATLAAATLVATMLVGTGNAAATASPFGSIDALKQAPGGFTISGWAIDPNSSRSIPVDIYADGAPLQRLQAVNPRPDVGAAYPRYGNDHGFSATFAIAQGTHSVCAFAISISEGPNTLLGCRGITLNFNPRGSLDTVTQIPGGITVTGWAFDPDTTDAINVDIYAGTNDLRRLVANTYRPDVGAAYPGAGSNHGFAATFTLAQGTYRICAYGLNVLAGTTNPALGCKTITLDFNPIGVVDSVRQTSTGFAVSGWAIDPDTSDAINVDIYADGTKLGRVLAGGSRPDVGAVYPASGDDHGYAATYPLGQGTHTICVYAINVDFGSINTGLGCRAITLAFNPYGSLDAVTATTSGIALRGWAIDPNTTAAINVAIYADGAQLAQLTASAPRPDVAAAYPGVGPDHGFSADLGLGEGTHQVCAYGINVGAGANAVLGCKAITLHDSPLGRFDSLTRATATSITVAGWAYDPNAPTRAISVSASIDGGTGVSILASRPRPDVAAAYPGIGADHGYNATLTTSSGEHIVCITALNIGLGANAPLGCKLIIAVHPVAPSAPQSATAVGGFDSATVSWTSPLTDGGAPPSYLITPVGGGTTVTAPAGSTTATVTGLTPKAYAFTVTAINVAGSSAPATSNTVTIQAAPPPQTTPAPISTSRYIRNITGAAGDATTMRAEGVADATANPSGHSYVILLDIGGQDQADGGVALSATGTFISYAALVTALDAYVDGYASAQKAGAPVLIALGTNNDMDVSAATGADWASIVVAAVARHAAGYEAMTIGGADDIEPGFSADATSSRAWLSGYLATTKAPFVFNGSADGCNSVAAGGSCNNGWTEADLYWLSAGAAPAQIAGLPQIYNTTMAQQWKYISLTGVASGQPRVNFGGPLTEFTACQQAGSCSSLTGNSAWTALWAALNSDPRLAPGSLPYSTDLRIN
ncbi:MAG TPA: fibronectin type III domain-containing protein [Jatrophihabitantaceae bacterium]|nr:fibronectin type III domain-containing protein [Jatrophihabitantaceae bacterium]